MGSRYQGGNAGVRTFSLSPRSVHRGSLILVNACYPYAEEAADRELVPLPGYDGVLLERRSAGILWKLLGELEAGGRIAAVSGWRSGDEQTKLYTDSLTENGADFTRKYVALPGHSEHETGLAVDLAEMREGIDLIRPDFPYRGICQKFRDRAPGFGYIERYPKSKEKITGIAWEPWHFRYVGFPHADIMRSRGLTLEEYHDFIRDYPWGTRPLLWESAGRRMEIGYLPMEKTGDTVLEMDDTSPCLLSGNNTDGFVVTRWCGGNG